MTRSRLRNQTFRPQAGPGGVEDDRPIHAAVLLIVRRRARDTPEPSPQERSCEQGGLQEVVVTAQKRTEDLQSVPISVVAIGTQEMQNLNIQQQDDYIKYLPSVTTQKSGSGGGANGPGFGNVIMRGISSDARAESLRAGTQAVGTYLDEQPITTIQGAMDVHLYDIQRIEALAGPQGTLYGASSEAGTIRIITNKPDPECLQGGIPARGQLRRSRRSGRGARPGLRQHPARLDNAAIRLVGLVRARRRLHRQHPGRRAPSRSSTSQSTTGRTPRTTSTTSRSMARAPRSRSISTTTGR